MDFKKALLTANAYISDQKMKWNGLKHPLHSAFPKTKKCWIFMN